MLGVDRAASSMKTFLRDEKTSQFTFQEIMVGDGDNTNKLSLGFGVVLVTLNDFRAFKN